LPMALLAWIVAPAVIPNSPLHPGITYWLLIIVGMGWECVLSLVLLYRELRTLRWSAIRQGTWLQTPRDPRTDRRNARLFRWLLPAVVFSALVSMVLAPYLNAPMAWLFPPCRHQRSPIRPNWLPLRSRASGGCSALYWAATY
jgi:uncharacterized protein